MAKKFELASAFDALTVLDRLRARSSEILERRLEQNPEGVKTEELIRLMKMANDSLPDVALVRRDLGLDRPQAPTQTNFIIGTLNLTMEQFKALPEDKRERAALMVVRGEIKEARELVGG